MIPEKSKINEPMSPVEEMLLDSICHIIDYLVEKMEGKERPKENIELPSIMIFQKNDIPYFQDMRFLRGIPTGVKFEIEKETGDGSVWLKAPGYGVIGGDYGNGSIAVNKKYLQEYFKPVSQPEQQETNLVGEFDARKWAKEFMRLKKHNSDCGNENWVDEELMIGWFANAIMSGYDNANWKRNKEQPDHIVDTNKKVEEWRELREKAITALKQMPYYDGNGITGSYYLKKDVDRFRESSSNAMTAAAKKIEELDLIIRARDAEIILKQKELENVKDGVKDIISKINEIGSGYLIGDASRDLEELIK